MLELKNLNKIYKLKKKQVHAIKDINLTLTRGEFVAILGESGSGKTTLLSTIGGMEEPTSGHFKIDGLDASGFNQRQWTDYRKNTIGFIFQDFNLIDHLTAKDNIKIALSLSSTKEEKKESRALELLEKVGMSDHGHQFPKELSGGQQQRIAIARALANEPEIILADEPTGALDPKTATQIMNLLKELSENDHLVIMVTHDEELAEAYATRVVAIDEGIIIKDTILSPSKARTFPPVEMIKSSLQKSSALKVAVNNLKVRKKSSIFAICALIPSIILVLILSNLVYNLSEYRNDIAPVYNNIVNEETLHYLSPMSEDEFEWNIKGLIIKIEKDQYSQKIVDNTEAMLYEPYDEETILEIESIPGVEAVIKPSYFDVYIDGSPYILVGLLPEVYKQYQYDFDFDYYPADDEKGLIMSQKTADALNFIEGEDMSLAINSYNGIPLHYEKQREQKNVYETSILKVFDPEAKSTVMSNYYEGYIFTSSGYIETLKSTFTVDDVSLVAFELIVDDDPRAGSMKYAPIGSKNLSDLLLPLRNKFASLDDIELFSIRKYSKEAPSNNFMMRHRIISDGPLDEKSINRLSRLGNYYTSQYDEFTVEAAIKTDGDIQRMLLFAKIGIAIVVILPSVLVGLILFISILLRTKEIGVLKSIGAKSKDIMTIFTLESTLLAISSGTVAIIATFPILEFVRIKVEEAFDVSAYLGSNPLTTNYAAIFTALVSITILISLLGLLPGRKASKLHPRVLLRRIG